MFFKNMVTVCFMLNLILILSRDNQDIGEQHHNTNDNNWRIPAVGGSEQPLVPVKILMNTYILIYICARILPIYLQVKKRLKI